MNSNQLAPEWGQQDAIVIVWPHARSDWTSNLAAIENTYLELSKHICKIQHLILVAYDHAHSQHILQQLDKKSVSSKNISLVTIPTNDTWVRDYGPVCVRSGNGLTTLDFNFDAWGGKYDYAHDNAFNAKLIGQLKFNSNYKNIEQILETGNIEINGRGELLCSTACFKRTSDSSSINLDELEKQFVTWFGSSKTYWIDSVQLHGDDTDGHIDTLARYCTNDSIVYSSSGHPRDPNNDALKRLTTQLTSIKKQSHNRFDLIPLPLPHPVYISKKQLPATYTNFLITNKSVLVPVFNDKQDDYALKMFEQLFPSREIIDIESNTLIQQLGGIHCATMQIPQGTLK